MKTVTVQVPKRQLSQLMADASQGDIIILTDGERSMTVSSKVGSQDLQDLEEDSPALAAELLKAIDGPYKPYSAPRMQALCEEYVQENRIKK